MSVADDVTNALWPVLIITPDIFRVTLLPLSITHAE